MWLVQFFVEIWSGFYIKLIKSKNPLLHPDIYSIHKKQSVYSIIIGLGIRKIFKKWLWHISSFYVINWCTAGTNIYYSLRREEAFPDVIQKCSYLTINALRLHYRIYLASEKHLFSSMSSLTHSSCCKKKIKIETRKKK